ncbi:hypothetical protein GGQ64_002569 [Rhizobium azooxidifex]|uniref:Uncharacterized protein n=1 Tax=Mycoplana azooxidifex TaxID=1636188 RepID=A0A7W6D5Z5_9HYPH|nr:hypothetical protein [Mycoplana azooxidifex]MBB3977363.1 hypothetical protein [Mycoplana azooxidifex]
MTGGGDFLVADLAPRLWRGDVTLIQLDCVSHSRMLTRTNPAKKSHEAQKLRSGDKFRQYNTVAGQWQYWWGEREGETMG